MYYINLYPVIKSDILLGPASNQTCLKKESLKLWWGLKLVQHPPCPKYSWELIIFYWHLYHYWFCFFQYAAAVSISASNYTASSQCTVSIMCKKKFNFCFWFPKITLPPLWSSMLTASCTVLNGKNRWEKIYRQILIIPRVICSQLFPISASSLQLFCLHF